MQDGLFFCTLFDSNYLDRGIVMYQSMEAVMDDFKLFVIAFDEKCEQVLKENAFKSMVVISRNDFEDSKLKMAAENRSSREYIWTCSGYSIKYVLEHYDISACTYIDADMLFYRDPAVLLKELETNGADVGIIAHGFAPYPEYRVMEAKTGRYCVEFNTFINNDNGKKVLNWWIEECLKCCTEIPDGRHFGDQKYLDELKERFHGIYEYKDIGAGVAPWNLDKFVMHQKGFVEDRISGESKPIIFCHFHNLEFIGRNKVNINIFIRPGKHDRNLIYSLYVPYVKRLIEVRETLNMKFRVTWDTKESYLPEEERRGLLRDFLTSEPNLRFLIRKICRFLLYKRLDFIEIE